MKWLLYSLILVPTWSFCYLPLRAQQYHNQLKAEFEKRKKALDEKLASTRTHRHRVEEKTIPRRMSQFSSGTLFNAMNKVIEGLEAEREHLDDQLKLVSHESLQGIRHKTDEDLYLRKLQLTLNIRDLESRIAQLERTEAFIDEQKENKSPEEIKALNQLGTKLSIQQQDMLLKLTNQQEALRDL